MIAAPAMSPLTWTMRRAEWAASRDISEMALEVAIEGHAVVEEIVDARGGVGNHEAGDLFVDDAGAGGDRIGEMALDGIAWRHRGGNAALRPGGRGAFADRRGGERRSPAAAPGGARRTGRRVRRRR